MFEGRRTQRARLKCRRSLKSCGAMKSSISQEALIVFWSLAAAVWTVCRRRDEDLIQPVRRWMHLLASPIRVFILQTSDCESASLVLLTFLIVGHSVDLKPCSSFKVVMETQKPSPACNESLYTAGRYRFCTGKDGRISKILGSAAALLRRCDEFCF